MTTRIKEAAQATSAYFSISQDISEAIQTDKL